MFVETRGYFYLDPNSWGITPLGPHANRGCQAYCDGHVSQLSQEEMLLYYKTYPNKLPWWQP